MIIVLLPTYNMALLIVGNVVNSLNNYFHIE